MPFPGLPRFHGQLWHHGSRNAWGPEQKAWISERWWRDGRKGVKRVRRGARPAQILGWTALGSLSILRLRLLYIKITSTHGIYRRFAWSLVLWIRCLQWTQSISNCSQAPNHHDANVSQDYCCTSFSSVFGTLYGWRPVSLTLVLCSKACPTWSSFASSYALVMNEMQKLRTN